MTSRSAKPLLVLGLLALLGCKAETFGADDLVVDPAAFHVAFGARLPGGTVTISAPWMARVGDSLWLAVDDGPAVSSGRDPNRLPGFRIAIPSGLQAGTHEVYLESGSGNRTLIGEIEVGGFSELRYAAGGLHAGEGETQPLPELMEVAGAGDPVVGGSPLMVLDVRSAQFRQVGMTPVCCYGVGASYRPGTFLAYRGSAGWLWNRISAGTIMIDTDSLQLYGNWWPKHELAPGIYLDDEKSETLLRKDTTSFEYLPGYNHPSRIAFSADSQWAVASHSSSINGALIVDRSDGSYHWSPGWQQYARPVFLSDGRLVVYGWRRDPDYSAASYGRFGEYLAHVDPVTGALLDSLRFGNSGSPYDLPFASTESGWIVLPAWRQDRIELSVRDPNSFLEIAHLSSPSFANQCDAYNTIATLEEPSRHHLYFVVNNCTGHVPVWTFSLPG